MMPVYTCQLIYLGWESPKMFICSALKWATYAYKCIYVSIYVCTHTHTLFVCVYQKKPNVTKKLLPVQKAVTCIKILQYFLLNPPFTFLPAAAPHRGICNPCCFLPQAEACAFQKALAKMSPLLPKTSKEGKNLFANIGVWGFDLVLVQTQRFQRSEPGIREAPTPEKLIPTGSNCLRLKTRTCTRWLSQNTDSWVVPRTDGPSQLLT